MRDEDHNRVRKIGTIRTLRELQGYEDEARKRGMSAREISAVNERRREIKKHWRIEDT